VEETVTASSLS